MAAHQALPSLGFSRQEHWSGLPFPSPMRESEIAQSCPTLSDPMDCSLPGFLVHHQLPKPTQTHVHRLSDAIQPSHPLSFLSPPAFNLSQHQGLILSCDRKVGNPFQTKQGSRPSCPDQEGRKGSDVCQDVCDCFCYLLFLKQNYYNLKAF